MFKDSMFGVRSWISEYQVPPARRSGGGSGFGSSTFPFPSIVLFLFHFSFLVALSGCSGCPYTFRGGSVPVHLKTIAIPIVEDQSGFGDPALRDLFTTELVQRFLSDGSLQMTDRSVSDCVLEGVITNVRADVPVTVTGGEQVAQRRITVTVRVTFQDVKMRKKVWEKDFTQYGDYPSGGGLTQRTEGLTEAVRKLTEDILNETVAGW